MNSTFVLTNFLDSTHKSGQGFVWSQTQKRIHNNSAIVGSLLWEYGTKYMAAGLNFSRLCFSGIILVATINLIISRKQNCFKSFLYFFHQQNISFTYFNSVLLKNRKYSAPTKKNLMSFFSKKKLVKNFNFHFNFFL